MSFNLKEFILEQTRYISGYVNNEDKYVISASMVGKEPLQNYLSIVHGKVAEEEISDATLGTIFHKGMECYVKEAMRDGQGTVNNVLGSEVALWAELPNEWILSGTADLVIDQGDGKFEIHDYKLTKSYARKMVKKEILTHDYTKQLQVLEALFRINSARINEDDTAKEIRGSVDLICDFFLKDSKAANFEPVHSPLQVPNKEGTEDMNATEITISEIIAITDSLQAYIESGEAPPKCEDLWPRTIKGKLIPTKCALYCSHGKAGLCEHYDPSNPYTQSGTVDRLVNW